MKTHADWTGLKPHFNRIGVDDPRDATGKGEMGRRVGNLVFSGEHTNSFHIWQGFMEGACLSGIDAANSILEG